jgi:hypothetical protein
MRGIQGPLKGFPTVSVADWGHAIRYCGPAHDLIAAGVATARMLAAGPSKRRDSDGDEFRIDRYWRHTRGKETPCIRLIRSKPECRIRSLPGGDEIMAQRDEHGRWCAESSEPTRPDAISPAAVLGLDFAAAPDSATCAQMLEEISEEAEALPAGMAVPELSVRIGCLMYWLRHRLPLPANLPDILRANVMSAKGVWAAATVESQKIAERRP